jgi:hypothetical protein
VITIKDIKAAEIVKSKYEQWNDFVSVELKYVTKDLLKEVVQICNHTKHMEEQIQYYDSERGDELNNWTDIEGEGYGWLWLNKPERKWRKLLKRNLKDFVIDKKKEIKNNKCIVLYVNTTDQIIYHFIEREYYQQDTVYTFSDKEIDF